MSKRSKSFWKKLLGEDYNEIIYLLKKDAWITSVLILIIILLIVVIFNLN